MEKWLITNIPTAVLGIGLVLVIVGLALGGFVIVRRRLEHRKLVSLQDVAGFLIAVVGVLYAVVLAFVVVIQWAQYNDASNTATSEGNALGSLYRDAVALGPQGRPLRLAVSNYTYQVAYVEWPYVAKHFDGAPGIDSALNALWNAVTQLKPTSAAQGEFLRRAVDDITLANVNRRKRIEASGSTLPTPLWIVVLRAASSQSASVTSSASKASAPKRRWCPCSPP